MVVLTALFQALPGKEAQLELVLKTMIPDVQHEPGALLYALHRATATPGSFLFFERYQDQAALDVHAAKPYLAAMMAKTEGLLAQAPVLAHYEEVAAIQR
jgi:quinol monooxygenase YgiN